MNTKPQPRHGESDRSYVGNIVESAKSVLEGMAVTFSYMFRAPTTVQYPDRVPVPIPVPSKMPDSSTTKGCKVR